MPKEPKQRNVRIEINFNVPADHTNEYLHDLIFQILKHADKEIEVVDGFWNERVEIHPI